MFAGAPHHVTQRGNHREPVFFAPGDQAAYLGLLRDYAALHNVDVVAYCLMTNHVHHVVIPSTAEALHRVFKSVHGRYAQRVNRIRSLKGHLWQGRYNSSVLDQNYFVNAVRYVELNPVRARMVRRAEDYDWSSAATHCGLRNDFVVDCSKRQPLLAATADWSDWLAQGVDDRSLAALRRTCKQNLPCGGDEFIGKLEQLTGRQLGLCAHGGSRRRQGKAGSR